MTKKLLLLFIALISISAAAQKKNPAGGRKVLKEAPKADSDTEPKAEKPKATIDMYRVITLERDTTYIDTSLSTRKDYIFNYLRKDIFGLMPFANDGQTYNTLDFGLNDFSPFPEFGYKARHFAYLRPDDMRYYSVATPLTELYFKTTIKQGQSLDAFITVNTSDRLNFSLAYKGLRSQGRYTNALTSNGNFRFTASYNTKDTRYFLKAHFTAQDTYNGENGGIVNPEDFESGDSDFKDRARLQVYFEDAQTQLKGNRYFIDHSFRINKTEGENNLYLAHQFNFENEFFEFSQATVPTTIVAEPQDFEIFRLGDSYVTSKIRNKVRYNRMYNRIGAIYANKTLGEFQAFVEDFKYNYYYNSIIVGPDNVIPSSLNERINTFGGQYAYRKNKWNGRARYSNSISSDQDLSDFDVLVNYDFDQENRLSFHYQKINKLPDHNYNLFQSSYISYNWLNDFKNEKINNIEVKADTKWGSAALQMTTLNDHLYFSNDATDPAQLIVSPKQYGKTITYLSLKVQKEFRLGKFALDNTVLYQKTGQDDDILNVPQLVTRNTLYYSDEIFKKAMFLQTGFTLNYFTKYYANDYNPLLGEFYVQGQKEIGAFPMLDFFVNARVRQTRIYLKAEHFNSKFGKNDFYSAPSYPYRDFLIRFGLVWDFFQ